MFYEKMHEINRNLQFWLYNFFNYVYNLYGNASLAQLVEQRTRNA